MARSAVRDLFPDLFAEPDPTMGGNGMDQRELTCEERTAIRALVVKWCANHDRDMGLPADFTHPESANYFAHNSTRYPQLFAKAYEGSPPAELVVLSTQ